MLAAICIASTTAHASGHNGVFLSEPRGAFIDGPDRPLYRLDAPFTYRDPNGLEWTAPAGEVVDGASIPKPAWSLVGGPFSGKYLKAAIIHDYYCCAKSREYHSTHHAFWLGMLAAGIGRVQANMMWAAVRFAGPEQWVVDPDADPPVPCKSIANAVPTAFESVPEETQAKAVAKMIAMARTLATTEGNVLDVVDGEVILTGTDEAETHLRFLHESLLKKFEVEEGFGLVSFVTEYELKDADLHGQMIAPWVLGQIPALDIYMESVGMQYPSAATFDGQVYAPAVFQGYSQFNVDEFRSDFLWRLTPLQRR